MSVPKYQTEAQVEANGRGNEKHREIYSMTPKRRRQLTRGAGSITDGGSPAKGNDRWRWFGAQDTPAVRQREDA